MSYGFDMMDPESKACIGSGVNHTSNTRAMMTKAMWGTSLTELEGKPGREAAPILMAAVVRLLDDSDHQAADFKAMEPENGWGSVQSTARFLAQCAELAARYPTLQVWVSE